MRRESATSTAVGVLAANVATASNAPTVESSAEPSSIIAVSTESVSVSVSEPIVETELSIEVVESTDSAIHSFPSEAFDAGEYIKYIYMYTYS